jgi:hypothetical protein
MSNNFSVRIFNTVKDSLKPALKTLFWFLKWMIPISLIVTVLDYFGILAWFADLINPFFKIFGLSGQCSLVFVTGALLNIYSAIGIISTLTLNLREITILAVMCLIAHNLIIETTVQKKTGSSAIKMVLLRLICAFVMAYILNILLPVELKSTVKSGVIVEKTGSFIELIQNWGIKTFYFVIKVSCFVFGIIILQKLLEEFGILVWLSRIFSPLMKIMGLPEKTSFLWIIANVIGLAYGGAIMINALNEGKFTKDECVAVNNHIGISHSMLEDSILFIAIGVPVLWIIFPRFFLAIIVVWFFRFVNYLNSRNKCLVLK